MDAHTTFLPKDQKFFWSAMNYKGKLFLLPGKVIKEGGHISIGLGDYPYLEMGKPTNADLIAKVVEHCKGNDWTVTQCSNLAEWAKLLPGAMMVSMWNGVMETKQVHNITKLHKFLGGAVVEAVQAARSL